MPCSPGPPSHPGLASSLPSPSPSSDPPPGMSDSVKDKFSIAFSIVGMFASHAVGSLSVFFCAEVTPTVIRCVMGDTPGNGGFSGLKDKSLAPGWCGINQHQLWLWLWAHRLHGSQPRSLLYLTLRCPRVTGEPGPGVLSRQQQEEGGTGSYSGPRNYVSDWQGGNSVDHSCRTSTRTCAANSAKRPHGTAIAECFKK